MFGCVVFFFRLLLAVGLVCFLKMSSSFSLYAIHGVCAGLIGRWSPSQVTLILAWRVIIEKFAMLLSLLVGVDVGKRRDRDSDRVFYGCFLFWGEGVVECFLDVF